MYMYPREGNKGRGAKSPRKSSVAGRPAGEGKSRPVENNGPGLSQGLFFKAHTLSKILSGELSEGVREVGGGLRGAEEIRPKTK